MAHRYRVIKTCFHGGVYREPGSKHALVTVPEKLDPVPTSLEYLGETSVEEVAPKPARKKAPAEKPKAKPSESPSDLEVI